MDVRASTPTSTATDASILISSSQSVKSPQESAHVSLSSMQTAIKNRIALRTPEQSDSSSDNLSDHEISFVGSAETLAEEGIGNERIEKILDIHAEKLAVIEEKRIVATKEVERRAENAQALAMMKGIVAAVSGDIETKKRTAVKKIEQQAVRERTILFIQLKSELLEHQRSLFEQIFRDYSSRLTTFQKFSEKLAISQNRVKELFRSDQAVLDGIADLDGATDQQINAIFTNLIRHDEDCFMALKPLVKLSINQELNKIETTFSHFEDLIRKSAGNLFIDQEHLALLRDEFFNAKEAFFIAEAVDCGQARNVALKNAEDLQTALQKVEKITEGASQAGTRAQPADQRKLSEKITLLQELTSQLMVAQQAWKQIAADSNLRIKTSHLDFPFFDLNILSKLETVTKSHNDHWIIGRRGEIEVVASTELSSNRKLYREGNDLIRLALFRDFGSDALRRFDIAMRDDLIAGNPLTVAQLQEVIERESENNPPAFYLSSVHPFQEVIFALDRPDDDTKEIKGDGRTFKIFSTSISNEAPLSEEKKREFGFDAVRIALVDCFKNLPEENQLFMMKRFDDQFSKEGKEKKSLTIKNVRGFFNAELKRQSSSLPNHDVMRSVLSSFASHLGAWLLENITSLPILSTIAPVALLVGGIAMGVQGDMNAMWRELKGRHPQRDRRS